MQERTIIDEGQEKRLRQFIQGKNNQALQKRMLKAYQSAIEDPRTHEIIQRKIGRNELCPCGSGLKFKKCCISKANKGEEEVNV